MKPQQHYRNQSLRLPSWNYSASAAYFLTLCTHNRSHKFGEIVNDQLIKNAFAKIVETHWEELKESYKNCTLDEFIIMPNHLHGIIMIEHELGQDCRLAYTVLKGSTTRRKMIIPKLVGRFKMQSAKSINKLQRTIGQKIWQAGYYDRVIRNEAELNAIREYIQNNPANWQKDRFNSEMADS